MRSCPLHLMNIDASLYDEHYFEHGHEIGKSLYTNYRWLPEMTIAMASHLVWQLHIDYDQTILDFGCAKGYLVLALRILKRQAYGVDISTYAIEQCPKEIEPFVRVIEPDDSLLSPDGDLYDWVFAKDVLEHIPYENIDHILRSIRRVGKKLFAVIPIGENGRYIVPSYENDVTHCIRESIDWWIQRFTKAGFKPVWSSYHMPYIKENYSCWERGNGFFFLR